MSTNQIMAGADVFGSDNEKLGTVADVGTNYFLVQKGFLFIKDLYLPTRTIARVDADRVYLNVPKHEAEQLAAEQLPTDGDAWYGSTTNYTTDTARTTDRTGYTTTGATDRMAYDTTDTTDRTRYAAGTTGRTGDRVARDGENITVPVVEEQLQAGVREAEAGRARIVKDVREEQKSIDVPVQHEEVYVTERAVNRPATEADMQMRDRDIEVPLREQEAVVTKQAVVTGEVGIHKQTVTDTQRVTDTVRREEVHVEGADGARVHTEGDLRNLSATQRSRYETMNEADRARYGRFTETERTQYDALGPDEQRQWVTEYDRRNPVQKAADAMTGRNNPERRA